MGDTYSARRKYRGSAAREYDSQRTASRYERWKWARELQTLANALAADGGAQEILDMPVGTGRAVPTLQATAFRVVAADISLDMVRLTRDRNPTLDEVVLCEGEKLPLKDGCVDAAVSIRLFQHLPRSVAVKIAAELRRVSRDRVYIQVPIEHWWSPIVRRLGALVLQGRLRHVKRAAGRAFPATPRVADGIFGESGLAVVRSIRVSSILGQLRLFVLDSR